LGEEWIGICMPIGDGAGLSVGYHPEMKFAL